MVPKNYLLIFLLFGMTMASVWDLRTSKIPNFLTFSMMLIGLAVHGAIGGINGLCFSVGGLFLGIGIFIYTKLKQRYISFRIHVA